MCLGRNRLNDKWRRTLTLQQIITGICIQFRREKLREVKKKTRLELLEL